MKISRISGDAVDLFEDDSHGPVLSESAGAISVMATKGLLDFVWHPKHNEVEIGLGGEWWAGELPTREGQVATYHHRKEKVDPAYVPVKVQWERQGGSVRFIINGGFLSGVAEVVVGASKVVSESVLPEEKGFWDDAEVISSYSRSQALDDGELVDMTEPSKEHGFRWPVAFTRALYQTIKHTKSGDFMGWVHDLFGMLKLKIRLGGAGRSAQFKMRIGGRNYVIRSEVGPGDTAAPVMTIGFPDDF